MTDSGTEPLTPEEEAALRAELLIAADEDRLGWWGARYLRLLATLDRDRARPDASLSEAWAEAEAALPEGWWVHAINAWSFDDMAYRAEAVSAGSQDYLDRDPHHAHYGTRHYVSGPSVEAFGPTPAAALQALTAALRARP